MPDKTTPALWTGPWRIGQLDQVASNGLRVLSTFSCGGGSTMGYKLAGYHTLGCVEIDDKMLALYRANFHPEHSFHQGIQAFNERADDQIPAELFDLDILDGSPPCSVFSTTGVRAKHQGDTDAANFGHSKKFREGQAVQRLDDLFLHFIATADRLRPRVVIAENVRGLIIGKAKGYVREIFDAFRAAGYRPQLFLLNAARMGVPQKRERTFFVAVREDLAETVPPLRMEFTETPITVGEAWEGVPSEPGKPLGKTLAHWWHRTPPGKRIADVHPSGKLFSWRKVAWWKPSYTLAATCGLMRWTEPCVIYEAEAIRLQTFPDDYARNGEDMRYVCGMSVPPYMMQRVALEVGRQVFGIPYDRTRRTFGNG